MSKAQKEAEKDRLARRRTVKGWVFKELSEQEETAIIRFIEGGPVPPGYLNLYNTCREQLGLPVLVEDSLAGRISEAIRKIKATGPADEGESTYMSGQIDAYEDVLSMIEGSE